MSFTNRALPHRDGYRMAPNYLLRCGLFAAIPPWQARTTCDDDNPINIATTRGMTASQHQGDRLDQADLDVLLSIFSEFALCELLDDEPKKSVDVPLGGLLIASGRKDGGKNRHWLRESLERLGKARFSLNIDKDEIAITEQALLRVTSITETRYQIELPAEIRRLFDLGFTGVHWHERQQLNHLGKWLHAFYSSHKQSSYRFGARSLGQLSGWSGGMTAAFPQILAKELKSLADVSGWRYEFDFKSERVSVEKDNDGVGGNAATIEQYRNEDFSGGEEEPDTDSDFSQPDLPN